MPAPFDFYKKKGINFLKESGNHDLPTAVNKFNEKYKTTKLICELLPLQYSRCYLHRNTYQEQF